MDADLFVYGYDVQKIKTAHDVRRGFALIDRMKDDPESRWRNHQIGDDHLGWTREAYILAGLVDAVNQNTKASAQRKASLKTHERFPLPAVKKKKEYKPRSVKEMDFGVLFGEEG